MKLSANDMRIFRAALSLAIEGDTYLWDELSDGDTDRASDLLAELGDDDAEDDSPDVPYEGDDEEDDDEEEDGA